MILRNKLTYKMIANKKVCSLGPVRWLSGQALVTTPDNLSSLSCRPETTMALREDGPDFPLHHTCTPSHTKQALLDKESP